MDDRNLDCLINIVDISVNRDLNILVLYSLKSNDRDACKLCSIDRELNVYGAAFS